MLLKRLILVSLSFFFFIFIVSLLSKNVLATKCDPYTTFLGFDNQCHSLRPFPGVTPTPLPNAITSQVAMCGNSVIAVDEITVTPPLGGIGCTTNSTRTVSTCNFSSSRRIDFNLDISQSELPIMGNTEDVVNRKTNTDQETLSDADKINNYVSWYLNGTIQRAEYPYISSNENNNESLKITDYSGPLKKLLPFDLQNQIRTDTVERAAEKEIGNQAVACVLNLPLPIIIPGTGLIFRGFPVPCNGSEINKIAQFVTLIQKKQLTDWKDNNQLPPDRSDAAYKDNFMKYWVDYRNWRGDTCGLFQIPPYVTILGVQIDIPIFGGLGFFVCLPNPLKPDYWANLFTYIPFSSTEDKQGSLTIGKSVPTESDGVKISNVDFTATSSDLYFAHMEESNELAALLQKTFASKDNPDSLISDSVAPEIDPNCKILETRTNDGDNLFANASTNKALLTFDTQFSCDFPLDNNGAYVLPATCTKRPAVTFTVTTDTPLADDVYSKLVAGTNGIVRKIFPKIGSGSKIGSFWDIPASTNVSFTTNVQPDKGSGQIYFPHIGAVSEYFLKGIQTLLRPKGYGEQIVFKPPSEATTSGTNCNVNAPAVSVSGLATKEAFTSLAERWDARGGKTQASECYNDVVGKAIAAGVNPGLAIWVWVHESDASNYDYYRWDFGVMYAPEKNFNEQLTGFLNRAISYNHNHSLCAGKSVTDMQAFAYIYATGTCDATKSFPSPEGGSETAQQYFEQLQSQWSWVAPGMAFPSSQIQ